MKLGCCYYPEQWPEEIWARDAAQMVELGLKQVRIGEFAWARLEPLPGAYNWGWLDRAIATLSDAGLEIILGTPTATPPKWLVDKMPDMIAIDEKGQPRHFGSRRHYCFSHLGYRAECARIVSALAQRYGAHPAIVAWQTDNEYGCHDTAISYSSSAGAAFRKFLSKKYGDIAALNHAWGTVFWSMEYRSFEEIDTPLLTVTEANPAHRLDYNRFASEEVVSFNRLQAEILRKLSPGRDIIHNFMGFYTQFDHHNVGGDLDVASWDSYPLGFLEQFWFNDEQKNRYARQGHPDIAAFHHDLYRGCSNGRWSVMEQQPGPVNWARYNPAPLDGMVRLWTLEAMAHGAELVSYFRWRQAPFAQEQLHAGLLRPDSHPAQGLHEARQSALDIKTLGNEASCVKSVALVFSYEAAWLFDIQPQGQNFRYLELVFEFYTALRQLGLNIDIVSPNANLDDYQIVVAPSLPIMSDEFVAKISSLKVPVLFGPRSGSKTADFSIPENLPPGPLQKLLPLKVSRVQSLRTKTGQGDVYDETCRWVEEIETDLPAEEHAGDSNAEIYAFQHYRYCAVWPSPSLLNSVFSKMASEAGIKAQSLHPDLRLRRAGGRCFVFNYGPLAHKLDAIFEHTGGTRILLGDKTIASAGVAVWE